MSSEESTEARRPSKKYCILQGQCSHSTDSCRDVRAMVNKHKQKKKKNQELRKEQQRIERSNWEKIPEVRKKQEKKENRKRAPASRNAYFEQWSKIVSPAWQKP